MLYQVRTQPSRLWSEWRVLSAGVLVPPSTICIVYFCRVFREQSICTYQLMSRQDRAWICPRMSFGLYSNFVWTVESSTSSFVGKRKLFGCPSLVCITKCTTATPTPYFVLKATNKCIHTNWREYVVFVGSYAAAVVDTSFVRHRTPSESSNSSHFQQRTDRVQQGLGGP